MHNSAGGQTPPIPPLDLRVFRVGKNETVAVRCLAAPCLTVREGLHGYLTHYHQKRSVVCRGEDQCEAPIHKINPIWYGFLPFELWDANHGFWISIVLQVTEGLEHDFRWRLQRGQMWRLTRPIIKKSGSPVRGELLGVCNLNELPEPFSVQKSLQILFHRPDLPLPKTPNPVPKRDAFRPTVGAAPPGEEFATNAGRAEEPQSFADQREALKKLRERLKDGFAMPNGKD